MLTGIRGETVFPGVKESCVCGRAYSMAGQVFNTCRLIGLCLDVFATDGPTRTAVLKNLVARARVSSAGGKVLTYSQSAVLVTKMYNV